MDSRSSDLHGPDATSGSDDSPYPHRPPSAGGTPAEVSAEISQRIGERLGERLATAGPAPEDILPETAAAAVKIVIVGGFGVGKTTMVGSVSEIRPLTTEETMTTAGVGIDDLEGLEHKTETTVAMDFGRISLNERLILYLFGTPGQERFWFLWHGLFEGALGAVVLVDTRRLEVSFDVLGRLEERGVPFVVAVNAFPQSPQHPISSLRSALDLAPHVPIVEMDARLRASSRDVLIELVRYLRGLTGAGSGAAQNGAAHRANGYAGASTSPPFSPEQL
jgi:signal recognition particle receptor subunit beta